MKILAFALCAAAGSMPAALEAADAARAMRQGREVALSDPARVAVKLAAELESCSVQSARWGLAEAMWEHALESGSYLHATYSPSRKLTLMAGNHQRSVFAVDEVLLPLPEGGWPPHEIARVAGGYYGFTKCDPLRLLAIMDERELGLDEVRPYKSLRDAKRAWR